MKFNDEEFEDDDHQQTAQKTAQNAYRVDDDNLEEKDLKRSLLFGEEQLPEPTEGKGYGGDKFGQENNTPSGDDKNNPSQLAGNTNAYLARTEPMEEHPEDSNFTSAKQDGASNYSQAQPKGENSSDAPKPEEPKRGDGENDRPHPQQPYQEGTADNEQVNIPGPNELPDQQKVGEDDEREHIET